MKNDSPKNLNCEFAPEIVDFVYGEMNNDRKIVFNLHLNNCSDCTVEIEDFSGIRFSIRDWKTAEFDNLSTPEIKIPYEISSIKTIENRKPASWFDAVRSYLTLSPLMSGAMAVVMLAVFAGFAFFTFNDNDKEMIAVSNVNPNSNNEPVAVPNKSFEPENEIIENDSDDSDKNIPAVEPENKSVENRVPVQINNPVNQNRKSPTVKAIENKQPKIDSTVSDNKPKTAPVGKKPRLNELPEEVEDNSLRLSDLFAELETKD